MRIRKEMIGVLTTSKTMKGMVKVKAEHAAMFAAEGRHDLVEDIESKILIPKNVSKNKPKSE